MTLLPQADDATTWDALCDDDARLAVGVQALCTRHGLAGLPVRRYDSGSLPVYAVGTDHVLKLFPPSETVHASTEARVMALLEGALPIATPRLLAADLQDGWHALLMTQLPGVRLVDAWPRLSLADRDRLADGLGRAVAALHALDASSLVDIEPRWDEFLPRQRASAAERQRARGLDPFWVEQVDVFLERWMPPLGERRVLLHTELMREHLMMVQGHGRDGGDGGDGWHASGVFDFEPAMVGAPEYDFASFGLFVACGDARFLERSLLAYGFAPITLDPALQCRLMAHALLHRYSNLRWYFDRLPAPGAKTLEDVAARWWPLPCSL